ncbi:MAG: hypothetical protein JWQ64_853 [Subtercola sp.]|nr:hypothetical protein [Subtercola sp.]
MPALVTRSRNPRLYRALASSLAFSVVVAGLMLSPVCQAARAMPSECRDEVSWVNGTTTQKDDGTLVEDGIHAENHEVCDFIGLPDPPDGPGGGDGPLPPAPPMPAPPGPVSPPPPASSPASVAPPCIAGSNNADSPGAAPGGATGSGQTVLDNVVPEVASGDIKIEATPNADDIKGVPGDAVTKSVTLDVNVGSPMNGQEGTNPFEGYTAEEAAQALYWEGDTSPQFSDIGATTKGLVMTMKLIDYAVRAAQGDQAALRMLVWLYPNASELTQKAVMSHLVDKSLAMAQFAKDYPELSAGIKDWGQELWKILVMLSEMPGLITGPDADSPEKLYVDASTASVKLGSLTTDNVNKGACGQVAAAVASDPGSAMTVLPIGPHWVRVTLIGTQHGPLVHELKTIGTPAVYCPPASVSAIAGQANMLHITTACTGTINNVRILSRAETDALSSIDRAQLLTRSSDGTANVPDGMIAYRHYDSSSPTDSGSVSLLADGNTALSGDSKNGNLYYKPAVSTGGQSDAVVAMATGADGKEHPFLVRIAVKTPPSCSVADGLVGSDHMATLQNGRLELQRNTAFTIDPKLLCTTDTRDTYSVTISGSLGGTKSTVNADGTVTYTWTNPDTIGNDGTLTLTAWDRDTGAPSTPVTVPVHVRDAAPVCSAISATYDTSTLRGAPLTIPLQCTMTGGLKTLNPPVPMIVLGADGGRTLTTPAGTFVTTATALVFTPSPGYTGTSTATVMTSSSNPFTNNLDGRGSNSFVITVTTT